ncbi:hypothetical protein L227DRAFT_333439 [Lentinus tigrinus ALCF2SS1-6]|uniref:Uncharacterized protein n=1 Tax=Lentinus tigrinus ALCF2SS1-6 TaxID=1328759 RepID=A0A5C2RWM2_9APHY|nr:hypothetical protein L227DRAFT_333439 [Lentinus tigrinus ALCF2SS1-6]
MNGESRTTFAMSSAEGRAVRQHPPRHIMRMKMRSSFPTSANDAVTTSVSLAPVPISVETTVADSSSTLSTEPPGAGLPTRSPRIVLAVRQADPTATYTPGLVSAPITVAGTLQATALSFNTHTFGTNTGTESGVPLLQPSGSSDNGLRTSQTSSTSATSTPPPAPKADRVPVIVGSICGVLALVLLVALLITRFRHARLRKWKGPFMERIVAHRHRISLVSGRTVFADSPRGDPDDLDGYPLCTSHTTIVGSSSRSSLEKGDTLGEPLPGTPPDRTPSSAPARCPMTVGQTAPESSVATPEGSRASASTPPPLAPLEALPGYDQSSGGKRKDGSESRMKAPDERSSSPPPAYSWTAGQ